MAPGARAIAVDVGAGVGAWAARVAAALTRRNPDHVRAVNYHHVPRDELRQFTEQLAWLTDRYEPLGLGELRSYLSGSLQLERPGLLLTFDDGYESHATYVAEQLGDRGITGWFFVPTQAAEIEPADQSEWAVRRRVTKDPARRTVDGRIFASWDRWREVSDRHIVGSHTHTHLRFAADVSPAQVANELERSYGLLEERLGVTERVFCWVGGETPSYTKHAAAEVRRAGTSFAFTSSSRRLRRDVNPLRLERCNIESRFPLRRVEMQCSGLTDLRYARKRRHLDPVFALDTD
ncbi:MAG: polysaccharide deacetylase family protein [Acidimicrobiales bacterium]